MALATERSVRRRARHALAGPGALVVCALACASALSGAASSPRETSVGQTMAASAAAGERLYRDGVSTAGVPLEAIVQGDVRVRSTEMPCANCHGRSGWGTAEGTVIVPPVVGSVLFAPRTQGAPQLARPRTTGPGTRPAYTDGSLFRALRDGLDPAGHTLSPTMPRYRVTAADAEALDAYLRSLSVRAPEGVTPSTVHLATIVSTTASAARRASMLDVLRTFVRFKNAGTRFERRRRERGPWDMRPQYETYRDWELHEWQLQGPPGEWAGQLEELYRREPVFAIVGGIADADWTAVDEFAARHRVPVILPQPVLPPAERGIDPFYSLYFSQGLALEAKALGHHLTSSARRTVAQLSRCGTAGAAAAAVLAAQLEGWPIRQRCIAPSTVPDPAAWSSLVGDARLVAFWLDRDDVQVLETTATPAFEAVEEVYVSGSLVGDAVQHLPSSIRSRARVVSPFVAPDRLDQHAARSLQWMKANGIAPPDRQVAVDTLFAATLVADALGAPRALESREYFIERLRHMAARTPVPSAYPSIAFDAARRFGSAGSRLFKVPSAPGGAFTEVESWVVPVP